MNIESLERPLQMLRKSGTVSGLCLARGRDIIYNLFPFSEERVADFIGVIDDILLHYQALSRHLDQMAFGFDGGNSVVVADSELRLVVFHMRDDEVDFIAKAARAFLVDYQTAMAVKAMSEGLRPTSLGARPVTPIANRAPSVFLFAEAPDSVPPSVDAAGKEVETLQPPALEPAQPEPMEVVQGGPVRLPDFVETHTPEAASAMPPAPRPAPLKRTTRITVASPGRVAGGLKPLRAPAPPPVTEREDDKSEPGRLAKLAASQPESTLPPPRTPRVIRKV